MVSAWQLDKLYFGILCVVFLQVDEELFIITSVDGRCNSIGPLCEHRKHSVVNEVVNQDNPFSGTTNEVGYVCPCIPDAACREDLLGEEFWGDFFYSFKNNTYLLISFYLVPLDIEYALDNLRVVINELRYHGESPHDANVDRHSSIRL